jgi:hypothetical protein
MMFWQAIKQTASDYVFFEQEIQQKRRNATNYDRSELTFMGYAMIGELPLQFFSRLSGGDFWGVDAYRANPILYTEEGKHG